MGKIFLFLIYNYKKKKICVLNYFYTMAGETTKQNVAVVQSFFL